MEPTNYSNIESPDSPRIDTQTSSLETLVRRLEEAGIDTHRFCQIHKQKISFTHHESLYEPQDVPTGNYGVKALDDLLIIDVDDWDSAPKELKGLINKKPTFTVQTPHSDGKEGHYYFKCNEFVPDKSPTWGDVQSNGSLAVGPGSVLESCDKNWHDCSLPGHGQYIIKGNRPIASIKWEQIPISDEEGEDERQVSSPAQNPSQHELPAYEEELADVGNAILRDLESVNQVSHSQLKKLLEGGVGRYSDQLIKTENGEERIDRSRQENLALLFLYGTIQQVGKVEDDDRGERILYATFDYHMGKNTNTTDGQRRKWLERGNDYKAPAIGSVVRDFDRGKFTKFLNLSSTPPDYRFRSGKCSEPNFNMARFAVDLLSGEFDNTPIDEIAELAQTHYNIHITKADVEAVVECKRGKVVESIHPMQNRDGFDEYPTKTELYEVVREFGSNLSSEESLRKNVLDELKESGMVKLASNGKKYVYYSSHQPDPEDAYWIRTEGRQDK